MLQQTVPWTTAQDQRTLHLIVQLLGLYSMVFAAHRLIGSAAGTAQSQLSFRERLTVHETLVIAAAEYANDIYVHRCSAHGDAT